MKKDERTKAIVLFNFAHISKKELLLVAQKMGNKYPAHEIHTDAKEFKKAKFDFNWFVCTVESTLDGVAVLHKQVTGIKTVIEVKNIELRSL